MSPEPLQPFRWNYRIWQVKEVHQERRSYNHPNGLNLNLPSLVLTAEATDADTFKEDATAYEDGFIDGVNATLNRFAGHLGHFHPEDRAWMRELMEAEYL